MTDKLKYGIDFDLDTKTFRDEYNVKFEYRLETKIVIGTFREDGEYKYIIGKLVEVGNNIFMPIWVSLAALQVSGSIEFVASDDLELEAGSAYSLTDRNREINFYCRVLEKWY